MAGMSDQHRKIIQRHRADLIRDLEPLKLLNDLSECLDEDDRDAVKAQNTRKDQAEELVDMLPRRGPKAFLCFVAALHKRQQHLAKPLVEESGIDIATILKGDVGMTTQHKQILLNNVENLRQMNLAKVVQQLYSSGLVDESDKQNLLTDSTLCSQRIDMLLTEILPRKGPKAFEDFARELEKVHPPMARTLLLDAGINGSSNDEVLSLPSPVQDTGSFTLDSPVQEILEVKPECLKQFCQSMDEEDTWGNGWKRFYQELKLPAGKETRMEGRVGGPTLNCIKGWISIKGRNATVQALLAAVNRAERKDCSFCLEKSLGCLLDYVDSGVDDVTSKMGLLNPSKEKRVKFFGDLDENQAWDVVEGLRLRQNSLELLKEELIKDLDTKKLLSPTDLIQQSKQYPIRKFIDSLKDEEDRTFVVKTLRSVLSTYKGVTGPLLPLNKYIREVGYTHRRALTTELCGDDSWKVLAHKLGMKNTEIRFLDGRTENPADEVLRFWEVKAGSTVGALYDILVELDYPYIADLL